LKNVKNPSQNSCELSKGILHSWEC